MIEVLFKMFNSYHRTNGREARAGKIIDARLVPDLKLSASE